MIARLAGVCLLIPLVVTGAAQAVDGARGTVAAPDKPAATTPAAKPQANDVKSPTTTAADKRPQKSETGTGATAKADASAKTDPSSKLGQEAKSDDKAKPDDPSKPDSQAKTDAKAAPAVPTEWPKADIEQALTRCTELLKGLDVVTTPEPAFREGDCGAPAPVRLSSVGKNPAVAFDPPALVTCEMVAALHTWVKRDLQPLARKHLGKPITKIESMSDYSCRNAYGRIASKLSEHGRANALDIRGFVAGTEVATVLEGWGPTQRDIDKQIADAKAAADKAEAIKTAAERADAERKAAMAAEDAAARAKAAAAGKPATTASIEKKPLLDGTPRVTITLPGTAVTPRQETEPTMTIGQPQHLGGPKGRPATETAGDATIKLVRAQKPAAKSTDKAADKTGGSQPVSAPTKAAGDKTSTATLTEDGKAAKPAAMTKTALFLHGAHDAACNIFGTTLGPEANQAHRNHFHVDMAERKVKKICD